MTAPVLAGSAALAGRARRATHVLPMRTRETICCLAITGAGVGVIWLLTALVAVAGGAR